MQTGCGWSDGCGIHDNIRDCAGACVCACACAVLAGKLRPLMAGEEASPLAISAQGSNPKSGSSLGAVSSH